MTCDLLVKSHLSVLPSSPAPCVKLYCDFSCCAIRHMVLLCVFWGALPVFALQRKHGSTDHKAGPEKITT